MRASGKPLTAGLVSIVLSLAAAAIAEAPPPIRIGTSASQTGAYALLGQNQLRGYQLCVKHMNEKGGVQIAHTMLTFQWQDGEKVIVWPDELAPGKPRFPTPPWSQRQ